jgi:hypothetical protein
VERAITGPAYRDHDLVFCNELGAPISPTRLTMWFGKARKAAGVPIGTLHTLTKSDDTSVVRSDLAAGGQIKVLCSPCFC